MARLPLAIASLLLVTLPASASLVEDALAPTTLHYQEDGGRAGDAPGTCLEVDPARAVTLDGAATAGMLMDVDDEADVYALVLEPASIGDRVAVDLVHGLVAERHDIAIDVFSPDCLSSVFNATSAYYDAPPADPYPEPAPGTMEHEAGLATDQCDPSAWKFLANQMHGLPAPADIYVEWTDGSYEYVAVQKSTPATVAMYLTSSNLDVTVARAVIVLPATWNGSFHLASGPCDAVERSLPEPPLAEPTYGEFTVQEAGQHVVLVYIARGTVEKTTDTVEGLVNDPPTSVPLSCHTDICSLGLAPMSYDLGSSTLAA